MTNHGREFDTARNGNHQSGPLEGIRVLDLSRILAGPTWPQLLGGYSADIIKEERPE